MTCDEVGRLRHVLFDLLFPPETRRMNQRISNVAVLRMSQP